MCGVFGFLSNDGEELDLDVLEQLAIETETRGRHAHGLAWIDPSDRTRSYRAPGRITDRLDCLERMAGAKVAIGHCRYATRGNYTDNANNHPFPCDGGWYVHNGTFLNHEALCESHDLLTSSACDSEVLGLLVEEAHGSLLERCRRSLEATTGAAAILGIWRRPRPA